MLSRFQGKGKCKAVAAAVLAACLLPVSTLAAAPGAKPPVSSAHDVKTESAQEQKHWVDAELTEFKQLILPKLNEALRSRLVTEEEWKSATFTVLNREDIDEPISIGHWATLLKVCLGLQTDQTDSLLMTYVYQFDFNGQLHREDAMAGLVKLLTVKHISGSATAEELEPAYALKDLSEVSEMQLELVKKAYVLGLLDGTVGHEFRPKDILTHAEAISSMYRVLVRLQDHEPHSSRWESTHWAVNELRVFREVSGKKAAVADRLLKEFHIEEMDPNQAMPVKYWNDMLLRSLEMFGHIIEKETAAAYTYKAADGEYIARDKAVASILKLYPNTLETTQEQKDAAKLAFKDYQDASDPDLLAQAKHQNLVAGYNGRFYPNRHITVAEAVMFIYRLIDRL